MKAIIFDTAEAAQVALESCNAIPQGKAVNMGYPPHAQADKDKPYSSIIKHPTEDKWGLLAVGKVEEFLGVPGEELTGDWFPADPLQHG